MQLREWIRSDHATVLARFDQAITTHVPRDRWTEAADGGGTSIAALLFHFSRHQDLAVHVAVAGTRSVLDDHSTALGLDGVDPWRGLSETEDRTFTALLDLDALVDYARAVHAATQAWIDRADLDGLLDTVPPTTQRLTELAGVPSAEVPWLHAMWDGKPASWLLMWPGIGHGHAHVGEATSIRNRMGLSPF